MQLCVVYALNYSSSFVLSAILRGGQKVSVKLCMPRLSVCKYSFRLFTSRSKEEVMMKKCIVCDKPIVLAILGKYQRAAHRKTCGRECAIVWPKLQSAKVSATKKWHIESRETSCVECGELFIKAHWKVTVCGDECRTVRKARQTAEVQAKKRTPAGREARRATEKQYYLNLSLKAGQPLDSYVLRGWSIQVRERDNNKCTVCGVSENLHAHHIKYKSQHPELALDLDNGITLCESHHREIHRKP